MNKRRKRSQVLELDDISDSCSAESSVEDDTFSVSFDQLDEEDSIPEYEEYLSESSVDSLDFERCESSSDEEKEVGVSERVGTEHVSDHEFYTEDEDSRDANCSQEPNTKLEDYRVLTYMNFVLSEGISVKTMQRMESLMTVLYNSPPPILYGEINKKLEDLKKEAVRSVSYYCHNCGTKKAGKKAGCSICSLSDNRLCETVTLIQCDYMKQIRSLLEEKGHEIVEAHRKIHSKKEMFESNDIRRYPGYQREVECRHDFTNHKINLVCTISSDGARFKRVSKREATPVLMRVEGVDMETRTGGKCMILIAMCYSDGGVKKNFVNVFVAK
ncbi:hypothetical protein CRE_27774 [Caenorhabditis remanei]|uniref:Uncharacterized protein n=1 Tax=Caenorhabditis remanei TaxID=31234 RepID=E3MXP8_CAERE|nr:hypothetical protein CRE_27774 [Caenorhabditis remanei]